MLRSRRLAPILFTLLLAGGCERLSSLQSRNLTLVSVLSETGTLGATGRSMADAAALAVDTANQCGGIGGSITLIRRDDGGSPQRAAELTHEALQQPRLLGLLGSVTQENSLAMAQVSAGRTPLLSPTASESSELAQPGWWFRLTPTATLQATALADAASQRGDRRLVLIRMDDRYGRSLAEAFTAAVESNRGLVLNREEPLRVNPMQPPSDEELLDLLSWGPEAIALLGYGPAASRLGERLRREDPQLPLLVSEGIPVEASLNPISGVEQLERGPGWESFRKRFQERYGRSPQLSDARSWDATALLLLAAAAGTGPEQLRTRIPELTAAKQPGTVATADLCTGLRRLKRNQPTRYLGSSGDLRFSPSGGVDARFRLWSRDQDGKAGPDRQVTISSF